MDKDKPLLIGPLPYRPGLSPGIMVPDYRHPGVKERIAAEGQMVEDECRPTSSAALARYY